MNTLLTAEQQELARSVAAVGKKHYEDMAIEWDATSTHLPNSERKRLADLGYLGVAISPRWGGGGGELMDALVIIEELAKCSSLPAFQVFEANTGPARVVELFGTDEQRARYLPEIIAGEATMAISISEPDAGSAASDLRTEGVRDGDTLVINGQKRWCSGAGVAEYYLVYVRLSGHRGARGIGGVIVPRDTAGLTFGPQEQLMGFHGIPSADMFFDDVRVPMANVVVPASGFGKLMGAFSIERLGNATMSLALAQAALDRTASYVVERRQFGQPIIEFQSVQNTLADMIMRVEAARLLIWRAATSTNGITPDPQQVSIAKCFANETARTVSAQAVELHGGYGYHRDYHVERYARDAMGWAIAGGTPTMQRTRIASGYLRRSFRQYRADG
ncbi:acyl-CoA dehydrogenase family protein [Actinophytocola sp.]|uniref:acyl-CoA dehydrogenase family protein n=1 Tax=Actinophytocola sp. TaxID=1872138 RepID=UPI003D6B554A